MSQSVSFQNIPANFLPPLFYVEFNNTLAGVLGNQQQPSLLIGQMLTTAPAAPGVPVFVPSPAQAVSLFGANSMLARMCATYFAADPVGPLWALPLEDNPNSSGAMGHVHFAGTAAASGTIFFYIGQKLIQVGVNIGDDAGMIGNNLTDAINSTPLLPVNAEYGTNGTDLVANNYGTQGNNVNLAINLLGPSAGQVLPPGITATITPMSGGATDPDLAGVAAAIGDQLFDFIGHPYGEAVQIGEMTQTMNDTTGRWAWNRQDYGHVWTASPETITSALTLANTLNDQHCTFIPLIGFAADPADFVADWMGTAAVSLRNLPSQPLQSLQLSTVMAAPRASWLTLAQENTLLAAGCAVPRSNVYGNVTIGQDVTTYKTNAQGVPDGSYRYTTTMFTLMAITRQLKNALVTKFGRSILVPDGTRVNPAVPAVSPNIIKAEISAQYAQMEAGGLVVNAAAMAAATVVQINPNNPNRVDIIWRPELANGLSMLAVINQFILNAAAAA